MIVSIGSINPLFGGRQPIRAPSLRCPSLRSAVAPTRQSPQRSATTPASTAAIGSPAHFPRSPLLPGQPPPRPRRWRRSPGWSSWGHPGQSNSPRWGGARHGGRRGASGATAFASRWVRIFSITAASSMQAMIRTAPPQVGQVSMSMSNTRLRHCAQVIEARRSADVCGSSDPLALLPLPRFAG